MITKNAYKQMIYECHDFVPVVACMGLCTDNQYSRYGRVDGYCSKEARRNLDSAAGVDGLKKSTEDDSHPVRPYNRSQAQDRVGLTTDWQISASTGPSLHP